jgi:signal peptidase I
VEARSSVPASLRTLWQSSTAREVIQTVALTLLIFIALRAAIQTFIVDGPSMQPGLYTGERLLIDRVSYAIGAPHRGDIVIFHHHHIPVYGAEATYSCSLDDGTDGRFESCDYVKRIIGVPGDTVQVTPTQILVNGVALSEPYVNALSGFTPNASSHLGTTHLGPGQYFMCGDNRLNSSDSRSWGPAERSDFVGRAVMVFYPFSTLHILPNESAVFHAVPGGPTTPGWVHALEVVLVVLLLLALLLAAALLFFTWQRARILLRPVRKAPYLQPADVGLAMQDVWIESPRGRLAAWYLPATNGCTLICCHGINDNRSQWLPEVARLYRDRGYGALLFDFAGHGQSEGNQVTYGVREQRDLAAALDYLRGRGDVAMRGVGVMGYSLGAITAILAAPTTPDLHVFVLESSLADLERDLGVLFHRFTGLPPVPFAPLVVFWGQLIGKVRLSEIKPERVIGQIAPRAVLIISDQKDSLVNEPEDGESLYAHASEPKQLWQVPEADHVQSFNVAQEEWARRVEAFLDEHLAPRTSDGAPRATTV